MTITTEQARLALWGALRDLKDDPELVPSDIPEFDEQHGPGGEIDGPLPEVFYQKLADRMTYWCRFNEPQPW